MKVQGNANLLKQYRVAVLVNNLAIDQGTAEQLKAGEIVDLADTPLRMQMLERGIIAPTETVTEMAPAPADNDKNEE